MLFYQWVATRATVAKREATASRSPPTSRRTRQPDCSETRDDRKPQPIRPGTDLARTVAKRETTASRSEAAVALAPGRYCSETRDDRKPQRVG